MVMRLFGLRGKAEKAEDPVCHMQVDMGNPAGGTHEHGDTTYYFCSSGCQTAFSKDPETYLSAPAHEGAHHGHDHGGDAADNISTEWNFELVVPEGASNIVQAEYACVCGCHPVAKYEIGSETAGSEHCCCGRVHFAGANAEEQLHAYMDERAKTEMDEDVGPYIYVQTALTTPAGEVVPVAYAQPTKPRK